MRLDNEELVMFAIKLHVRLAIEGDTRRSVGEILRMVRECEAAAAKQLEQMSLDTGDA